MNGYLLLAIELAAILVVCVGLALFLGWVLGKRSARAKLTAEQESKPTPPTPEADALKTSGTDENKEPTPLTSRAVPVTTQAAPVAAQSSSPIVVASTPDSRQPVSSPSPFAPSPSATGTTAPAEAGTPQPDLLNDRTVSDDSTVDTHMIPRIADQATPPAPGPEAADPRLLEAETRANDAETKAREAEARIEEANQRAREAEAKAQEAEAKVEEAEAKVEEAGQQVTQADQRVSEAEARATEADQVARAAETRAAEAETRAQEADQHISDAEQARRQVVELEEKINKQEIDMARLENRATTAWDKTMPTLIERIESLEDDLSRARREAAELQAMLATGRDQTAPTPAPEVDAEEENVEEETGETEVIKEDPWQTIGPGTGTAQETPIAFASSTLPSMQPAKEDKETEPEQDKETEPEQDKETEPEPTEETAETDADTAEETEPTDAAEETEPTDAAEEGATAEATDAEPVDERTDEEQEVHSHEQLAPTAAVEHEVEIPDHDEKDEELNEEDEEPTEDKKPEEPEQDEEETETRLIPLIPEPTFTDFEEFTAAWKARETASPEKKPESATTTAWPEPDDAEAVTATRLIPVIKEAPAPRPNGADDLSALTDTGSFARLIATGPAPEAPSFTAPLDIPETEYLTPTIPAYPVTAHHDDATIPDIPRITAPIAQPFEAEEGDDTPDSRRDATPSNADLLIDETEVDEVPVTAGLSDPEPAAEPRVNAGHIIAPQFSMTKEHDGILRSPLEPKGQQLSISLEEDYTLADPIDEGIEVMDAPEEEFPVGVGIPPEDYPRVR